MLGERIAKHQAQAWLVNTGWTGGAHGTGTRMKIKFTRAMIHAALAGLLDGVQYEKDKLFNLDVPLTCPDVPADVLKPRNTWADKDAYDQQALKLARMFADNFEKFASQVAEDVRRAGPSAA
jgi:phosphoenolpyruvate carboxykinase (ATP)